MDTDDIDDFDPMADLDRAQATLTVRVESRRYGKPMTIVDGLPDRVDAADLASTLKKRIGTGGTATDGHVELQGDHRDRLPDLLRAEGFSVA